MQRSETATSALLEPLTGDHQFLCLLYGASNHHEADVAIRLLASRSSDVWSSNCDSGSAGACLVAVLGVAEI